MTKQRSTASLVFTPTSQYCVIYRTGGTENFRWHRSLAMSRSDAVAASRETARMGFPCHVELYASSVAIGLPTTYAVK